MKLENISDNLNEARQLAHGLKLFHSDGRTISNLK